MANYSSEQLETIRLANLLVASLSVCGSFFMILLYFCAKELRVHAFKLVMLLALGDFLCNCCIILSNSFNSIPNTICSIQGFIMDSSHLSVFTWCLAISFNLYQIFVKSNESIEKYFKYWFILAYIFLPTLQTIPFITNSYEYVGSLCTLKQDFYGNLWRLVLVYIPIWVHILFTSYFYISLYGKIKIIQKKSFGMEMQLDNLVAKTMKFPLILIFTQLPLSVLRLIQFAFDGFSIFELELIAMILLDLQGLLNAIAYGWNGNVKSFIYRSLQKNDIKNDSYLSLRKVSP
ncbi:hypothetical protein SteCoe_34399 [Stentor coeruleus]|uniref:G-protein coupled receptors family 2 profile 2 domain-containing protein n=1 Tax=Stentor coeruleus TaxID=5963 RepID=A0A1R2AUM1_9CILI|nr:hypothetical protein SteCoe_34399 [Stentor coeruleus]